MKEVQTKPEGDPKIIDESKENSGTFLRIQLYIKGFSIVDWVYHFTSKNKLNEKYTCFERYVSNKQTIPSHFGKIPEKHVGLLGHLRTKKI